jgi:hypothetical protein
MRYNLAIAVACLLALWASPGQARARHAAPVAVTAWGWGYTALEIKRTRGSVMAQRGAFYGSLSGACRLAARQGGPCGCHAEEYFFGRSDHQIEVGGRMVNLWIADTWRHVFAHVPPAPGTAAVWPGRHVAPVIAVSARTVTVKDSWATHEVSKVGLVFVDPRSAAVHAHRQYAQR